MVLYSPMWEYLTNQIVNVAGRPTKSKFFSFSSLPFLVIDSKGWGNEEKNGKMKSSLELMWNWRFFRHEVPLMAEIKADYFVCFTREFQEASKGFTSQWLLVLLQKGSCFIRVTPSRDWKGLYVKQMHPKSQRSAKYLGIFYGFVDNWAYIAPVNFLAYKVYKCTQSPSRKLKACI